MGISIDAVKAVEKNSTFIHDKNSQQVNIRGKLPQLDKEQL